MTGHPARCRIFGTCVETPGIPADLRSGLDSILLAWRILRLGFSTADVMFRVMRDGKRGRAQESAGECACVLLAAIGEPIRTHTMLSKFPSTLVADWLRVQGGLRG